MKLKYYGTGAGAGIPEICCSCRVCEHARRYGGPNIRTRSQATLDEIMIDCPVDAYAHSVYCGLDIRRHRHILITHAHADHFSMTGGFASRFQDDGGGWTFYMPPISAAEESERIAKMAENNTKFPPQRYPRIVPVAPFTPFWIGTHRITPLPSNHAASIGTMLYLIEQEGKALLWVHDSGYLLPETIHYLREHPVHLNAVSLDCTLGRGQRITASHMDIDQCADTACLLRQIGCADEATVFLLSHMGHLVEKTHDELRAQAQEFGFLVAYDGMELNI